MTAIAVDAIRERVAKAGLRRLHLMCAAPAEHGVHLGHRLTALDCEFVLYERDGDRYVPVLTLPADLP